jgi:methionyl-tRNA formyltransferase
VLELASGRGVVVAAGHGRLRLTRVQESGMIEEDADGWATRRRLTVGAVLGVSA